MTAAGHEIHVPFVNTRGYEDPIGRRHDPIKRLLDFPIAVILLLLFSPIILLALLLVRITSRGPAVYTQKRVGLNGGTFTILKIRTMFHECEPTGPQWCVPGDPRVTPVGRILRFTHLDELPQLVNILRGEMSLIGPRPERPEIVAQLERVLPNYHRRMCVRPGVTGLAQVLQAPDTDIESVRRKLNFDLFYVDRASTLLDIRIMIGTALHLLAVPGERVASLLRFPDDRLHRPNEEMCSDRCPIGEFASQASS
jgi:lipopolysaccharide/colanic/teichoic acid biosynthesis glycosyltransferase